MEKEDIKPGMELKALIHGCRRNVVTYSQFSTCKMVAFVHYSKGFRG